MDILGEARRRAFSMWLRTGRLPGWLKLGRAEFKFNPWHDPDDGRFTFAGSGRYFAPGSGGTARGNTAAHTDRRRRRTASDGAGHAGGGNGPGGGGGDGMGKPKPKLPFGGFRGGNTGGAGATGSWDGPAVGAQPSRASPTSKPRANVAATRPDATAGTAGRAVDDERTWQQVERNGYTYSIDSVGRTRRVTGILAETDMPRRSRTTQAQAGKPDRRASDDGGHYIAARFNGPTDAFNHFAQDSNFNRGAYRALEDQWAGALRLGKQVEVEIVPVYERSSGRPSAINVWFSIDGKRESLRFPNEPSEKNNAK